MAKQLAEAGEEVWPLVLFDAWIPREIESLKRQRFGSIRSMMSVVQSVLRIGLANLRRELQRNDSTNKAGAMKRKVFSLVRNFTYVAGSAGRAANAIDAVMRYQPKPYRGRVIFVASEQLNKDGVPELWRQLAEGGLVIHTLSGNHESYIRNSPEAAARLLERTLDEFQQVAR
jgi:thioesterase domain-containing protein